MQITDELTEVRARISSLEAENRRMRELLGHAVQIIAVHVPKDALGYSSIGYPDEEPYPLRDEFLANMRAALSQEEKS